MDSPGDRIRDEKQLSLAVFPVPVFVVQRLGKVDCGRGGWGTGLQAELG